MTSSIQQTRSRSLMMLIAPLFLLLAALACASTPLVDTPVFMCPTPLPPVVGYRTPVPLPPTPYVITPPQDFYRGDAVFVGARGAANRVRFRLQNVYVLPSGSRAVVVWSLEVRNIGSAPLELLPIAQMTIAQMQTASGADDGTWRTSDRAMREAGITGENYSPLPPGATRIYRMAAYAPMGSPRRFSFTLNPDTGNAITWINQTNPFCNADVAD